MIDEIIWGSLLILFILCVFIIPAGLYVFLKKRMGTVPVYLPVLAGLFIPVILAGIHMLNLISESNVVAGTLVTFLFLFLMMDLAVIAPYPYFEKKIGSISPRTIMALPVFIGFFFFFCMISGDMYEGKPMPLFSASLPLTGWILDSIIPVIGFQDPVYAFGSPVYGILREAGLFLEVLIIAIVYYWVLSMIPKQESVLR